MMVSNSYKSFEKEAPKVHKAWMETAFSIDKASTLDKKTRELTYLAVLAASRLESGLPFHVKMAKESGATRDEIISSILVGLPAVGNAVISSLPVALDAFDSN